jgi:organic hydroperoxide reductase OsmC/OhrA
VSYRDDAEAVMPEDDRPIRITEIRLRPQITVRAPATERRVLDLADLAHRECFVANSLRSEIAVVPTVTVVDDRR